MLLTSSVLSTTSKQCFEQPTASFLVCSLIFIEYKSTKQPRLRSCFSLCFLFLIFRNTTIFTFQIHHQNRNICGVYSRDTAGFLVCSLIFIEYKNLSKSEGKTLKIINRKSEFYAPTTSKWFDSR